MRKLFRQEAIEHKSFQLHGNIILKQKLSDLTLVLFFLSIIFFIAIFLLNNGFSRKETVNGVIIPHDGLIAITAPQNGILQNTQIREGQLIEAGTSLFSISTERIIRDGEAQAAIGNSLSSRINRLSQEIGQHAKQNKNKISELNQRIESIKSSIVQLDDEIDLQIRKIQIFENLANRLGELAKIGTVSKIAADERAAELIEQKSKLSITRSQKLALQRELTILEISVQNQPLQAKRESSELNRSIEELYQQETENELRRQLIIRAEKSGRVAGISVHPGQVVLENQRLATLLPENSRLEAELYVPTKAIGFVHSGTEVLLRYTAFPYQKFGQFKGHVREVALVAVPLKDFQSPSEQISSKASIEPVYRLRATLDSQSVKADGKEYHLRPGMQLSASLVLERRTLAEWIFEPLLSLSSK